MTHDLTRTPWSAMLRTGALACAVLISPSLRAADNELTARERAAGWRLLFDGKTYDH